MILSLVSFIQFHILPLGALGVFLACLFDEVSLVVPASFVLIAAGFIFLRPVAGLTSGAFLKTLFVTIAVPGALGLTLGAFVIYAIAYFGGKPLIDRYGKFLSVSWSDIETLDVRMDQSRFDEWFIFLAWVLPIIPSGLLNVFCGATRISPKKYAALSLAGTFVKSITMALVGFYAGRLYLRYAALIDRFETLIAIVIIVGVVAYVWIRKSDKKH